MEGIHLLSAFVSSLGFWMSLSLVAILIITHNMRSSSGADLSIQYVSPGTLADKASCRVGVAERCNKAKTEGERLACTHKNLVTCYAEKRIPDGVEPEHVTQGGEKGHCAGLVAYAENGPFSNRTVFPVCLGKGRVIDIPRGHPYRYTTQTNKTKHQPGYHLASYYTNIDSSGYIVPTGRKLVGGHWEYTLPNGETLPYGLTDHLVRLNRDHGYEVFPVYKMENGVVVQADLSTVPFRVGRR